MRPIGAILLCVGILGGMYAYTSFIKTLKVENEIVAEENVDGEFVLQVVCTFDAVGDEFGQAALLVKFRDQVLIEESEVKAGEAITVAGIPDLKAGRNDFFVVVTPSEQFDNNSMASDSTGSDPFSLETESGSGDTETFNSESDPFSLEGSTSEQARNENKKRSARIQPIARAVNIQVLRDDILIAEKTLWSNLAGPISDLVVLEFDMPDQDDHEH